MTYNEKMYLACSCLKELHRCWEFALQKYGVDLRGTKVTWSQRMTSCAGTAFYERGEIKLSLPILFSNPNFVNITPAHEAAHIIAFRVFKDKGHGRGWRRIARELGITDKRCHSYQITKRKV